MAYQPRHSKEEPLGRESSAQKPLTLEPSAQKPLPQEPLTHNPTAQEPLTQEVLDAMLPPTGNKKSRRRKRSRRHSPVPLVIGIVCLLAAAGIGGFLIYKYLSAGAEHDRDLTAAGMDVGGESVDHDTDLDDLNINWDALREINPDIVGWIMIPDTKINYPIVQTDDNAYYLTHLFDKTYSEAGAIFLDYHNDPGLRGWNNIIYGHNLIDGSMFASLKLYREKEYFDEHKTVLLATPNMNYKLEVAAALVCDADDKIRQFGFIDRADYQAYAKMLLSYAVFDELEEGEIPENLYCLATCTDTNYSKRTVVLCKMVEQKPPKNKQAAASANDEQAPAATEDVQSQGEPE